MTEENSQNPNDKSQPNEAGAGRLEEEEGAERRGAGGESGADEDLREGPGKGLIGDLKEEIDGATDEQAGECVRFEHR